MRRERTRRERPAYRLRLLVLIVLVLTLVAGAGCSGSGAGIVIEIGVEPDGSIAQRVAVQGVEIDTDVSGWSRESSATAEFTRSFADPSELPEAEAELLTALLGEVAGELGYVPVVLDRSKVDVVVEDYLFFKLLEVSYRPPEVDFRPPHCLECEGEGRHGCLECDQTGSLTCATCTGEGALDCTECEAQGSHTCEECEGAGYRPCSSCEERGWRECYSCDGDGVDSWGDSCWSCDGSGRRDCNGCSGTGRLDCWPCDDTGEVECRSCAGEGRVECVDCFGFMSVDCPSCEGQGTNTCFPCGGVGSPTSADLAAYDSALDDSRIDLVIDMPGLSERDAQTSWRLVGQDTVLPDEVSVSSRVPNWPLALGSGGGLLLLSALGVTLSVRRIRRRIRERTATPVPPVLPPQTDEAVQAAPVDPGADPAATVLCRECGSTLKGTATFCTECGVRR